jgi:hypothetical protein
MTRHEKVVAIEYLKQALDKTIDEQGLEILRKHKGDYMKDYEQLYAIKKNAKALIIRMKREHK